MTNSSQLRTDLFQKVALEALQPSKAQAPSPLSIRWTHAEKNDLVARAGDLPVSAYAKSLLFSGMAKPARLSPRNPLLDHQLLGQILAQLGRNTFAPDLAVLSEAVKSGSLPLGTPLLKKVQ